MHPAGQTNIRVQRHQARRPEAEAVKEIDAHGVSIIELAKTAGKFGYVKASTFNRRITASTPMNLAGPARGSAFVKRVFSTDGTQTRGTINNCGNGYTPWGTYLTAEENWAGYFIARAHHRHAARTQKDNTRPCCATAFAHQLRQPPRRPALRTTAGPPWCRPTAASTGFQPLEHHRRTQRKPADGTGDFR